MVDRYSHWAAGRGSSMILYDAGEYVRHTDYADLERQLVEARAARDEAIERAEAAEFASRNGVSLSEDAIHAIRERLNEAGVPLAAFIDDHVGNAIAQRDAAEAERDRLTADNARLRESGAGLANAAYNLAQNDAIPTRDRVALKQAQEQWDAALAGKE